MPVSFGDLCIFMWGWGVRAEASSTEPPHRGGVVLLRVFVGVLVCLFVGCRLCGGVSFVGGLCPCGSTGLQHITPPALSLRGEEEGGLFLLVFETSSFVSCC